MLLTTNTDRNRQKPDNGKRRTISTSTMKPRKDPPLFPFEYPGVRKLKTQKPKTTFFQTSDLADIRRRAGRPPIVAAAAAEIPASMQTIAPAKPKKPKAAATGKKGKRS